MKHLKKGRKFGRIKKQRDAMLRSLLGNLIMAGKITTTEARAKELRPRAEKIIFLAKKIASNKKSELVCAKRQLLSKLPKKVSLEKMKDLGDRLISKNSGHLRITKSPVRTSDGAKMAIIEILEKERKV